jgi:NADH:ubiquinone oxidoreductase subunit 5 (subunit L)/multisubunit Na+/H+ antiporter MnhA subunit
MEPSALPWLLGLATLLPLASFFFLLLFGSRLGKAYGHGAYIATGAIVAAGVLSFVSLFVWLGHHFPGGQTHHAAAAHAVHESPDVAHATDAGRGAPAPAHSATEGLQESGRPAVGGSGEVGRPAPNVPSEHSAHVNGPPLYYAGDYYALGVFGKLRLTIGYYIDSLTICMFCLVTLIASCIHFYAMGYMHDELHEVTDHQVTLRDGSHLKRRGRHSVFFQYMSLFCFSMLGLVLAGNIAMVFVFWELVGICSYFLIGFYIERKSACNAANKAFIVNRIGDFGMIIGLMALWGGLGTFAFGDVERVDADGSKHIESGIFSLVRSGQDYSLRTPDGLVRLSARDQAAKIVRGLGPQATAEQIEQAISAQVETWRTGGPDGTGPRYGYGLLVVAGIGIFCGCVGKSAQFPLHVWLPDAMEGPTPVSALVHSATMVAAGVYLVGRFFPVFAPEVLLVIAVIGCITLFMAATIAITATDIKRVLAYSTVSQLGYMMLALGVGGWVAGLLHLITHAFFKSLLFLCSGSVIHAVHTNEMTEMGGLRKKMPITAVTMLIGCLAIAGISVPFVIGFSGYYSKDRILEQAFSFMLHEDNRNFLASLFFYAAAGGAMMTAFYMFRMWYLTFAGKPRDQHRYDHAHESPRVMTVPLMVLALFATGVAWQPWSGLGGLSDLSVVNLLEQSRPMGTLADAASPTTGMTWPNEHFAHEPEQHHSIVVPVTWLATLTAWAGIALATVIYCLGYIQASEVRRQFEGIYRFLLNKWWFDELYDFLFVRPSHFVARLAAAVDRRWIDGLIDGSARFTRGFAVVWDRLGDHLVVDGSVNAFAGGVYGLGVWLRGVQTGRLRQYVMFVAAGALAIFVIISFFRGFYWAA